MSLFSRSVLGEQVLNSSGTTMRQMLLATTLLGALVGYNAAAGADEIDPLHLTCATCLPDNGTFTPAPNGFLNVSVTASPSQSGTNFLIKELIPNNVTLTTATATGTVGATPFTTVLTQAQ